MNNVTLAHVGGELVLIGGVAFYFHRKTALLQQELEALKKANAELCESVLELREGMQQLGSMVMQSQQQTPPPLRPAEAFTVPPRRQPLQQRKRPKHRKPQPPPQEIPTETDDSDDETIDDRELDRELEGEYTRLTSERKCEGDTCTLMDQ